MLRLFVAAVVAIAMLAAPRVEASPSPVTSPRGTVNAWAAGSTAVVLALAPLGAPPKPAPVVHRVHAMTPPAPKPATTQTYSGSCGGWQSLVAQLWPASAVPKACAVMKCETGGTFNPAIKNAHSSARGLMQILILHAWRFAAHGWSYLPDVFNPWKNLVVAHDIWSESGWSPWVCA